MIRLAYYSMLLKAAAASALFAISLDCRALQIQPTRSAVRESDSARLSAKPVHFTYGSSVEKRPLIGCTFGTGANKTLIMASIHGNERDTRPLAEKLIAYLTAHPGLYAGCTVTVLPCVNPDGWAHATRVNARQVDLNRNFPVGWHSNVPGKLSRGGAALSEPESAALTILVKQLRPDKIVSIHNPLHLLDWSDGKQGQALADLISSYDHYPVPKGGVGYPTPGSFGQLAESLNCAVVTLELPAEPVDAAWKQNRDALLAAIRSDINVKPSPALNPPASGD